MPRAALYMQDGFLYLYKCISAYEKNVFPTDTLCSILWFLHASADILVTLYVIPSSLMEAGIVIFFILLSDGFRNAAVPPAGSAFITL